ncbi:hypothetical protein Rhopal_004243-T1 [Rhodotorula paludigena]|uniref:DUF803-domain-containing protein n=1 Tax=Rhodotorula paludigena TaxID=86838 RepID=A0AAV5GMV8_9BASI|nr:hypothetical protein Rhopal_004243-T1 [Rhodotorula paludigena]
MSSTASSLASATSGAVSASASATQGGSQPASYKVIGVLLAVGSGLVIGASFILKKKGLLNATKKAGGVAGEGHPYLKSVLWWSGMILMIVGEILNVIAYAFADAILVTPMGSLAVVTSGILAHFILKEKLTTFGWLGSALCILGSVIIAVNGPEQHASGGIEEFQKLFISVRFLVWVGICIAAAAALIWAKKNVLVYIFICSLLGGLSVACTSGLGAAILKSIRDKDGSQWKHWFMYFLIGFCVVTLLLEINYLNKALELFNTAMVTAIYFVVFTTCTIVTTIILNKGFDTTVSAIVTLVLGFLVIVLGVALLQLSKVDPEQIESTMLDRRTTLLLSATRAEKNGHKETAYDVEDPGMDTIRGLGGALGSVHRAISMRSRQSRRTTRMSSAESPFGAEEMGMRWRGRQGAPGAMGSGPGQMGEDGLRRYQLYDGPATDEPMPLDAADKISLHSNPKSATINGREKSGSAITFADNDNLHLYAASRKGPATQHVEQPRLEGTHVHTPTQGDFSIARSGSLFADKAYADPFSEENASAAGTSGHGLAGPQRQGTGDLGARPTLAQRLSSAFSTSSPDLASQDFAPAPDAAPSTAPAGSRGRFSLSPFGRGGARRSMSPPGEAMNGSTGAPRDHRVAHPRGPRDAEAQAEEEALVPRRASVDSEPDGLGPPLEQYDTRDAL